MLELRPNCECCDKDLPPDAVDVMICTYECTFCRSCVETVLLNVCPNCGGAFEPRPIRPAHALRNDPASTTRVLGDDPRCSARSARIAYSPPVRTADTAEAVADEARPTVAFKNRVSEAYASLRPGMQFVARRTYNDGDIAMFVGATADYNVWHVDDAVVKESWFERRVVPGLLTASLTTQIGSWLGWLATRMDFQFLRPVYTGDTVTCSCTVTSKNDESRRIACDVVYRNDEGTIVMRGIMEGFPTRIPPAAIPFLDRDSPS